MSLPLSGIHHIALLVDDLERAERFHCDTLGLALDRRWPDPSSGGTRSVWLKIPGGAILMLERSTSSAGKDGRGWHLVALSIRKDDRPSIEASLASAGIPIESRTDYTLYVRDPEGNRVAFSHFPDR